MRAVRLRRLLFGVLCVVFVVLSGVVVVAVDVLVASRRGKPRRSGRRMISEEWWPCRSCVWPARGVAKGGSPCWLAGWLAGLLARVPVRSGGRNKQMGAKHW